MKRWNKSAYIPAATWLIAIAIHGLLLVFPVVSLPTKQSSKSESGRVRVTVLPQAATAKKAAVQNRVNRAVSSLPVPALRREPPQPRPIPTPQVQPSPVPQKARSQPNVSRPSAVSQPKIRPNPTPASLAAPGDLVVNLGRLPNTKPCKNLEGCWQSGDSQWRAVYQNVQQQLSEQGYQLTELELEDDTGFRVSQVSKNGATKYYLHLLSTLQGTVYVLNPTQLDKDEVAQKLDNPS